jgi:hypothetical protein
MNVMRVPSDHGIALAWLQCGSARGVRAGAIPARVTVLKAVNSPAPRSYLRRALNLGNAADMGNSSGTCFASLSASSYST